MAEAEHQDINTHIDQNPCQLAQICPSTFEKQEPARNQNNNCISTEK